MVKIKIVGLYEGDKPITTLIDALEELIVQLTDTESQQDKDVSKEIVIRNAFMLEAIVEDDR